MIAKVSTNSIKYLFCSNIVACTTLYGSNISIYEPIEIKQTLNVKNASQNTIVKTTFELVKLS